MGSPKEDVGNGPTHEFTRGLNGHITHTELVSQAPQATRSWCQEILGWKFQNPFPTPCGEYHLFAYSDSGGGGIREVSADEIPGSTPTVHVEDADEAYEKATTAGAESINPPTTIMKGVRTALVRPPEVF